MRTIILCHEGIKSDNDDDPDSMNTWLLHWQDNYWRLLTNKSSLTKNQEQSPMSKESEKYVVEYKK